MKNRNNKLYDGKDLLRWKKKKDLRWKKKRKKACVVETVSDEDAGDGCGLNDDAIDMLEKKPPASPPVVAAPQETPSSALPQYVYDEEEQQQQQQQQQQHQIVSPKMTMKQAREYIERDDDDDINYNDYNDDATSYDISMSQNRFVLLVVVYLLHIHPFNETTIISNTDSFDCRKSNSQASYNNITKSGESDVWR